MKCLIYDFWAYDIPTEIAEETLKELGIPFEVKKKRQVRDPSAPEGLGKNDEWVEIYVDPEALLKWLENRIEKEKGILERCIWPVTV